IDIFLLTNPDKAMNRAEKALLSGIQALIAETTLQDRIYSD
ncbi:LysR family transcriptional regulator, partial [Mesorhizobium sp. M00.F.Ca.ET.158.01.1.1]